MPNLVQSAVRAIVEAGVDLVAAWNRKRLPKTGSPFLVGIHEPMRSELTLQDLAVTGSILAESNGRHLKMGANPARPDPVGHHWFFGDGMVACPGRWVTTSGQNCSKAPSTTGIAPFYACSSPRPPGHRSCWTCAAATWTGPGSASA